MYLEKNRKRSQTRFYLENKKKNCKNYWYFFDKNQDQDEYRKKVAKASRTPAICSCFMCGNERKHFGYITFQERKFFSRKDIELYKKYGI